MNRYTPIPPIATTAEQTSDDDGNVSITADSDDQERQREEEEEEEEEENRDEDEDDDNDDNDDDDELDETFQLSEKEYEDVKSVMKKRMLDLWELDTFDNRVRRRISYSTLPLRFLSSFNTNAES